MKIMNIALILGCLLLSVFCIAQTAGPCSPVGAWYGGSDYKYLTTITPITGTKFAMRGEAVYDNNSWGYKAWTSFSGVMTKTNDGRYVSQVIAMFTTNSDPQPPQDSFELDAARSWVEFTDCDHLKFSYDFFGAYFDLNKVPFVDQLDLNYLPPGGIVETYHRMPTTCPACDTQTGLSLRKQR